VVCAILASGNSLWYKIGFANKQNKRSVVNVATSFNFEISFKFFDMRNLKNWYYAKELNWKSIEKTSTKKTLFSFIKIIITWKDVPNVKRN